MRPHGLAAVGGAHQVDLNHQIEVVHAHLGKALVTQNAGVVHQNVHPAPGVDGLLHHGFDRRKVGDRGAIGQRLATGSADFIDHRLRRADRAALAVHAAAQVIDQHLGAARRQCQRMLAAQAATGARHDGHAAVEIDRHAVALLSSGG